MFTDNRNVSQLSWSVQWSIQSWAGLKWNHRSRQLRREWASALQGAGAEGQHMGINTTVDTHGRATDPQGEQLPASSDGAV